MKTKLLILLITVISVFKLNAQCTGVYIPNTTFKTYLLSHTSINLNGDGNISCQEAEDFTGNIDVSGLGVTNLTGIGAFVNITTLWCNNNQLTSLDVSNNTALIGLYCHYNQLTSLDVSNNTDLNTLYCYSNELTSLDVSNNPALGRLDCENNQLTSLDVSNNVSLSTLYCFNNQLTSLDVSNNTALGGLYCFNNQLTSLDVSNNIDLQILSCNNNQLTSLDVSANTKLRNIYCAINNLYSLKLTNGNSLNLDADRTRLGSNPNLSCIQVDDVAYANANWASLKDDTASFSEDCSIAYTVNIPDTKFKSELINNISINTDGDSEISYVEALTFTGAIDVNSKSIADLTGIEAFINTTSLSCFDNTLTNLNVATNTALTYLSCSQNGLTDLDVAGNTALTELYCSDNMLTTLNIANGSNTALVNFFATNNANLTCIQVDEVAYADTNFTNIDDATASFSTNCGATASIVDATFNASVAVHPNPVSNTLNIKLPNTVTLESVQVYNLLGKQVLSSAKTNLNVSTLTAGMYVVKINTEQGKIATRKIIKM